MTTPLDEVYVIAPGPEDLAAIGANLMDPRRREAVLQTSLRTSLARLRRVARDDDLSSAV